MCLVQILRHSSSILSRIRVDAYVSGNGSGPITLITKENHVQWANEADKGTDNKNLLWILYRQIDTENKKVSSWIGFNIKTRDQLPVSADVVEYLPTINASATDLATVFERLNEGEEIRKKLVLDSIVVVMDQALYAKACEIKWGKLLFLMFF